MKSGMSNWGYQLHLASGEVERRITTKADIKMFLNAMYGGLSAQGEPGFDFATGPLYERLPSLERTLLVEEEVLDFYADEYARNGIRGTCGFYFLFSLFLFFLPLPFYSFLSTLLSAVSGMAVFIWLTKETPPKTVAWYKTRKLNHKEELQ